MAVVLGVEDLLIDRLRAFVHWRSDEDGRWAGRLVALYSKAERWADILSAEPAGRAAGRHPRDPEEALLAELDRLRLERNALLAGARRIPPADGAAGGR